MDLTVTISQEAHDCVLAQLHKKEPGVEEQTVTEWLQAAIDGKVNWCMKRNNPVAVLEAEKAALAAEKEALEKRVSDLERANG